MHLKLFQIRKDCAPSMRVPASPRSSFVDGVSLHILKNVQAALLGCSKSPLIRNGGNAVTLAMGEGVRLGSLVSVAVGVGVDVERGAMVEVAVPACKVASAGLNGHSSADCPMV